MDPAGLIASFEEQPRTARPVPLTDHVRLDKNQMESTLNERVDETEVHDILDQLRASDSPATN